MCLTIDLKRTTALIRLHKSAPREVHQRDGSAGISLSLNTLQSGAQVWAVCVSVCVTVGLEKRKRWTDKALWKQECRIRPRQVDGTVLTLKLEWKKKGAIKDWVKGKHIAMDECFLSWVHIYSMCLSRYTYPCLHVCGVTLYIGCTFNFNMVTDIHGWVAKAAYDTTCTLSRVMLFVEVINNRFHK